MTMRNQSPIERLRKTMVLSKRGPMRGRFYPAMHRFGRLAFRFAIRCHLLYPSRIEREEPFILVSNHISHNDPMLLSVIAPRRIDWMARSEFFQNPFMAKLLGLLDAFSVDRHQFPLPGIRESLRRLEKGHTVGVFSEGEVTLGADSILNGGKMKEGACLLARRADVPIIPCVILGSPGFERVSPWLPTKSGRVYVAFGEPVEPNSHVKSNREGRRLMSLEIGESMRRMHQELCDAFEISDEDGRI